MSSRTSPPNRVPDWIECAIMYSIRGAGLFLAAWGVIVGLCLLFVAVGGVLVALFG